MASETDIPRVTAWENDTWCVWTKSGHRPRFFHQSRAKAEREALRLAAANPGKNFHVLHMVAKFGIEAAQEQGQ